MLRILKFGHGQIGKLVYPLVILLASTGLLLSHSDALSLDETFVSFEPLLTWYGIAPRGESSSFLAGEHWVIELERELFVDGAHFARADGPLVGAVEFGSYLVLATPEALFIVQIQKRLELVERVGSSVLPGVIARLGHTPDGNLIIKTDRGDFVTDEAFVRFDQIDSDDLAWSTTGEPPQILLDAAVRAYRGEGLPLSRVLLDLHSGRIFGRFGPWLMDAAALLLLFLSISGALQRRRSRRSA